MTTNVALSLASQRAIKALAQAEPTILLPAHDPDAPARLASRRCMFDTEPDSINVADDFAQDARTTLPA